MLRQKNQLAFLAPHAAYAAPASSAPGVPATKSPRNGLMILIQLFRSFPARLYLAGKFSEYSLVKQPLRLGKGLVICIKCILMRLFFRLVR